MNAFVKKINGIYQLKIPFERIYTSVFLMEAQEKNMLVDCGTTAEDVDTYIVPALKQKGYEISDIKSLILTHRHTDHAGGLGRVLALAPSIAVVTDACTLFVGISTYPLAGHTEDSIGVFDERTHTLITGDGLQGAGVDRYHCSVKDKSAYLETLERIKNDERVENLLLSHAYEPWNSDGVFGREQVLRCLEECRICFLQR